MNQRSRSVEVAVRTDDDSALSRGGGGAQQQLFSLRPLSPVYLLVPSSSSSSFTTARLRGRTKHVSSGGRLRGIEAVGRLSCPTNGSSVRPRSLARSAAAASSSRPAAVASRRRNLARALLRPLFAPLPRFSVIAARPRCVSVRFREPTQKRIRNSDWWPVVVVSTNRRQMQSLQRNVSTGG